MANILDYLRAYGHRTFDEMEFGALDNLILSQLSYIDYQNAVSLMPCTLPNLLGHVEYGVQDKNNFSLLDLAARSKRFSGARALCYKAEFSREQTRQFAAVSFLLDDGSAFISFRGTDSTLVGWKEDFMLGFTMPVPAQQSAREYLSVVGGMLNRPLRVGGHSKGGNLAIYAAANCSPSVQDMIVNVYSNDGPGFPKELLESEAYLRIKSRIVRFIPESSAVGILMDSDSEVSVVKSNAVAFGQHNPYSWQVADKNFILCPSTNLASDIVSQSQKDWFRCLDEEKRRLYTDTLFDILASSDANTIRELRSDPIKLINTLRAIKNLPDEDKTNMTELIKQFFSSIFAGGGAAISAKYKTVSETIKTKLSSTKDEE